MRALLPSAATSVDLLETYEVPAREGGAPFLRCNMISSLDGAVSIHGSSGALGGPPDRRVFQVLRCLADVVLVGAGTMRAEHYGPARLGEELRARRVEKGWPEVPPVAVVTSSGNLEWSSAFFTDAEVPPIVFVPAAAARAVRERAEGLAEVVAAGDDRVDPRLVLEHLGGTGYGSVLLEGGPGLNAEVVRARLLDELCLTISPRLVSGSGPRVLAGPELPSPLDLEVVHVLEEDGFFFYRLSVPATEITQPSGP